MNMSLEPIHKNAYTPILLKKNTHVNMGIQ